MKSIKKLGLLVLLFTVEIIAMQMSPQRGARFQQVWQKQKHRIMQPQRENRVGEFYLSVWKQNLADLSQEKNWHPDGFPRRRWIKAAAQSAECAIKNKRLTKNAALAELVTVLEKIECIKDKEKIPAIKRKFFDRLVFAKEVKEEFQHFKKYAQQQKIKQRKIQQVEQELQQADEYIKQQKIKQQQKLQQQKFQQKELFKHLQQQRQDLYARIPKVVEQEIKKADEYSKQQTIKQRKIQQEEILKQKQAAQKIKDRNCEKDLQRTRIPQQVEQELQQADGYIRQQKIQQRTIQQYQLEQKQLFKATRQQNRDFLESIKQTPRFEEFQRYLQADKIAEGWRWFRGPSEEWKSAVILLAFQLLEPYKNRSQYASNFDLLYNYIFSSIRTVINAYNETCYFRVYDRDKLYCEISTRIKDLVQYSITGVQRGPTLVDRLYGEGKLQFSLFMNRFLNKIREAKREEN